MNRKYQPSALKVISTGALIATLGVGVAFGGNWLVKNWEQVEKGFSGANLYTQEDLDKAFADGSTSAFAEKEQLLKQVEELKTNYENLNQAKQTSDSKITQLEQEINTNKQLSAEQLAQLQSELDSEKSHNQQLDLQLNNLQSELTEANKKIDTYEQIIQQYENDATAPVSYYDGDRLIKALLVDKGNTYQLAENLVPVSTEDRQFIGFAVDGEIVNHNDYVINTTTVFNAVFDYKVTTIVNGELNTQFVRQQTTISDCLGVVTPLENQEFSHWIDSNGNVFDTSTVLNYPITLTAVFNEVYNLTFTHNNETIATMRLVNGELDGAEPVLSGIQSDGCQQFGWRDENGNYITDVSAIKSNTTLSTNMLYVRKIFVKYGAGAGSYNKTYSTPVHASVMLTADGYVQTYYLNGAMLTPIANNIKTLEGVTLPTKPWSLSPSNEGYLISIGNSDIGSSTADYYVYLDISAGSVY